MAIKTYRPTTQTLRYRTTIVNDDITSKHPHKPLVEPKQRTGGRRNSGDITSWHRGGGHKRKLRIIDFKRDKTGIPATVATIEYDPNRSSRIALLAYADGEKGYILQPDWDSCYDLDDRIRSQSLFAHCASGLCRLREALQPGPGRDAKRTEGFVR